LPKPDQASCFPGLPPLGACILACQELSGCIWHGSFGPPLGNPRSTISSVREGGRTVEAHAAIQRARNTRLCVTGTPHSGFQPMAQPFSKNSAGPSFAVPGPRDPPHIQGMTLDFHFHFLNLSFFISNMGMVTLISQGPGKD
jgi:hypothetical protein